MNNLNEEVRVADSTRLNEQRTTTPSKRVIPSTSNPKTTPKQK